MAAGERLKLLMESQKGKPNGVAGLNESGKVPSGQLPAMDYVPTSRKVNGKALTADITLSAADTGAIPVAEKGATGGVATLDDSGKVPREQLPAMNYDPAGSAEAVQDNLNAHTNNKSNPHGVTAQQVGADPAGSASAVQGNLNTHTSNKNNPHGVTAAQVGTYEAEKIMASGIPAMFGLGAGAVPSDVLAYLGKYAQHWWRRRTAVVKEGNTKTRSLSLATVSNIAGGSYSTNIKYSSQVVINGGKVKLSGNIKSLVVDYKRVNGSSFNKSILNGAYFKATSISTDAKPSSGFALIEAGVIYKGASNISAGYTSDQLYGTRMSLKEVSTGYSDWEYIQSSDRSAYPDSGEQNGYEYQYLGIPFDNATTAPKITTGSYVGTETSRTISVSFNSPITAFIICALDKVVIGGAVRDWSIGIYLRGSKKMASLRSGDIRDLDVSISDDGKTISWSGSVEYSDLPLTFNANGTYLYMAIHG